MTPDIAKIKLSHSALTAYRKCPEFFRRRYFNALIPMQDATTANMSAGTIVHAALETLYSGTEPLNLDAAYQEAQYLLDNNPPAPDSTSGRLNRALHVAANLHKNSPSLNVNLHKVGKFSLAHIMDMILAYADYYENEVVEVLSTEKKLSTIIQAPNFEIELFGTIDGLKKYNNIPVIWETKTKSILGDAFINEAELSDQATCYVILAARNGFSVDTIIYNAIQTAHAKIKTDPAGCFARLSVTRTATDITRFIRDLIHTCEDIAASIQQDSWIQNRGYPCTAYNKRCEYADSCISGTFMQNMYQKDDPDNSRFSVTFKTN
jgi:hypothetical protein